MAIVASSFLPPLFFSLETKVLCLLSLELYPCMALW